jgi:hypothetical protein
MDVFFGANTSFAHDFALWIRTFKDFHRFESVQIRKNGSFYYYCLI